MKRASGVLEMIKTVVLILLVVCMVTLASIYILGTQSEKISLGNDISFDRLVALRTGSSDGAEGFDHEHIMPAMIGIKTEGEPAYAVITGSGYISDLYSALMPYLSDLFGPDSSCTVYSQDEGELVFRQCMSSDSYVYLKYHTEYPFSILYVHSKSTDYADIYRSQKDVEGYVYELFLLEENGSFSIVTRDMRGKVLRFDSKGSEKLSPVSFDMIAPRGEQFVFADEGYGVPDAFWGIPVLKNNITTSKINVNGFYLAEFGDNSGEKFRDMMRLFNFNPDKMNAYVDSEDKNVSMYVESHGVIRISESYFEYTAASDGGIPIERFLNYTDASGYDLYDAIKAAEYFANKVRAISSYVFGGDASIGISDIGYRDGVLYIEYSYYYDNIPVEYANGRAAMRFEIEKDKFVGVSLDPVSISPSGKTMHSFSQKMIIDAYSGRIDDLPEYPDTRLVYLIDEAAGKERCADWEIVYYRP